MSNRVAVVVDSGASLSPDAADHPQMWTVPMQLTIGDRTYHDGRDLTPSEFYRMLPSINGLVTTSAPAPAAYAEAFASAAAEHSAILCLTVSRHVSSSYESARTAADNSSEEHRIDVIDTESAAGGEGLLATEALRAARSGAGLDDVAATVKELIPRVRLLAFLDTLYYVWKSGRVPRLAYLGSSLLKIKPLLELTQGDVRPIERLRTARRASQRMLELMRDDVRDSAIHATVMHGDDAEAADALRRRVEAEFDCKELFVSQFSPVMGAHTGPGLVGVAWWRELSDESTQQREALIGHTLPLSSR